MALKDWKKTVVDQHRTLWENSKTDDFVILDEQTQTVKRDFPGDNYSVQARNNRINKQTENGHFRFFKTKAQANKFAKSYRKKN